MRSQRAHERTNEPTNVRTNEHTNVRTHIWTSNENLVCPNPYTWIGHTINHFSTAEREVTSVDLGFAKGDDGPWQSCI